MEKEIRTTQKIKVGFGPIVSGEDDLHVRKWRIDPIVNGINQASAKYCASIFLNAQQMPKFDILVMVREVDEIDSSIIAQLKKVGKILIYDIVDRPYLKENAKNHAHLQDFIQALDGLIASSPLHIDDFGNWVKHLSLIEHPIINTQTKDYSQKPPGEIKIIWQGYSENQSRMQLLQPVIKRVALELNKKIKIIYHTNMLPRKKKFSEYKIWTIHNWEKMLVRSDIAVEIKPLEDHHAQRKPATKIISYMAAGLPVICTPSPADRLVLKHGQTGFFAYSEDEWYACLRKLVESPELRKTMGEAARERVLKDFSAARITQKYLAFFDRLLEHRHGHTPDN